MNGVSARIRDFGAGCQEAFGRVYSSIPSAERIKEAAGSVFAKMAPHGSVQRYAVVEGLPKAIKYAAIPAGMLAGFLIASNRLGHKVSLDNEAWHRTSCDGDFQSILHDEIVGATLFAPFAITAAYAAKAIFQQENAETSGSPCRFIIPAATALMILNWQFAERIYELQLDSECILLRFALKGTMALAFTTSEAVLGGVAGALGYFAVSRIHEHYVSWREREQERAEADSLPLAESVP